MKASNWIHPPSLFFLDHKMKTHNQAHADQRVTLRWTVFVFMTMILWKKCADRPELNQTRTPKQPAKETAKYSHWQRCSDCDKCKELCGSQQTITYYMHKTPVKILHMDQNRSQQKPNSSNPIRNDQKSVVYGFL